MATLYLDFETRASIDIRDVGDDIYLSHSDTSIMCMAYKIDAGETYVWYPPHPFPDLTGFDEYVAHNARFERLAWKYLVCRDYGLPDIPLRRWVCTMAMCYAAGYEGSLEKAGQVLGLGVRKIMDGRATMLKLARPRTISKKLGRPVWWTQAEKPDDFLLLYEYCKVDVDVTRLIDERLPRLSRVEQAVYAIDQRINDRGIPVDMQLAESAVKCYDSTAGMKRRILQDLTLGEVQTEAQRDVFLNWLAWEGVLLPDLTKKTVAKAIKDPATPDNCRQALQIRQDLALTSLAKYEKMLQIASRDCRARGCMQYHGAHTGRWAGRGLQLQNPPKGKLLVGLDEEEAVAAIDLAVTATHARDPDLLECLFDLPAEQVLSSLIRNAIRAEPGKRLLVVDFAGIENRVLAWLAGEHELLQGLKENRDLYIEMAARIFDIGPQFVTKEQRQLGKIAILGLGYQMGAARFRSTCSDWGITPPDEATAEKAVTAFREAYRNVVNFWYDVQRQSIAAIKHEKTYGLGKVKLSGRDSQMFLIQLPSGRRLHYPNAHIVKELKPWGEVDAIHYSGVNTYTRQWTTLTTYGGKLTENIVQAIARDLLVHSIFELERAGYPVIFHVHDEVVCERELGEGSLAEMMAIMRRVPAWATGCPIEVAGFEAERFRKD